MFVTVRSYASSSASGPKPSERQLSTYFRSVREKSRPEMPRARLTSSAATRMRARARMYSSACSKVIISRLAQT